ncbi:hypothetical protein ACFY6U_46945 [Streptomyces sp. NPDC013157]|uniref:hypothetical protein n=1 Tax=Streptomyces sp. NPDC013157 TaxID=3364861 RepID=UPI0036AA6F60
MGSGIKAATVPQLDPLQSELLTFTAPFVEARIQLMPALDGLTPANEWARIAPTLRRSAPKWCSMAADPLALYEMPGIVRSKAHRVDGAIRSHQAGSATALDPAAHSAVRLLHRELGDLVNEFSRALSRLAKRGMGVM